MGKHATVNQMLARESVKVRMEADAGISFTEFSYMLLQANDYRWLHAHHGCRAPDRRLGPVGQHPLGRRPDPPERAAPRSTPSAGRCSPRPTARSSGKTTGGRVWLDAGPHVAVPVLPALDGQADDRQVAEHPGQFTLLPVDEIEAVVAAHEAGARAPRWASAGWPWRSPRSSTAPRPRPAAAGASAVLFGGDVADADAATFEALAGEVPTFAVAPERLADGVDLPSSWSRPGPARSKGEARRLADQGGVSVNGRRAAAGDVVGADALLHGRFALLRRGKSGYQLAAELTPVGDPCRLSLRP